MKEQENGLLLSIRRSNISRQLAELLTLYIEGERDILENAEPREVNAIQGGIKSYRKLLRKITEPIKKGQ